MSTTQTMMTFFEVHWKGLALALAIAVIAAQVGAFFPLLGASAAAIALGVVVRFALGARTSINAGAGFAAKRVLKLAVILLGASLSLQQVWQMGAGAFAVIAVVVIVSLASITWLGRMLRLSSGLSTLIAVGTAICGASAIAAASPVIDAEEDETAYAVTTIFAFNALALFLFPLLGRALDLSADVFGVWAGTAIHDTSSVVAAAYTYSHEAGAAATVVKLARTTLLLPVLVLLAAFWRMGARNRARGASISWRKVFPWFILGFVALAALRSSGLMSETLVESLTAIAKFLIVVALAGVGLGADLRKLRKTGLKPLFLGLLASLFVAVISLALTVRYVA